jgi:hypothetical protein
MDGPEKDPTDDAGLSDPHKWAFVVMIAAALVVAGLVLLGAYMSNWSH